MLMSFYFFSKMTGAAHRTADGAASAVGVAVRRRWHRQKAVFKALSTVLVVLDCSVIFEISVLCGSHNRHDQLIQLVVFGA